MLTESSVLSKDLVNISNGMKHAFSWYMGWLKKLPQTDADWDRAVAESEKIWRENKDYEVVQNVVIELLTDLERWA